MGTRHLTAVQIDGDYKVAQYGQWDGYPEGQGTTILAFLREVDMENFKTKTRAASFLTQDEIKALWVAEGADPASDFVSMAIADRFNKKHPQLSRDTGADVLAMIVKAEPGIKLKNSIDFAGDSLFCEYAYVIDLDKGTFEVFKGFNKEPIAEGARFANAPKDQPDDNPVRLVQTFQLDALPDEATFLAAFAEPEEEEAEAA